MPRPVRAMQKLSRLPVQPRKAPLGLSVRRQRLVPNAQGPVFQRPSFSTQTTPNNSIRLLDMLYIHATMTQPLEKAAARPLSFERFEILLGGGSDATG